MKPTKIIFIVLVALGMAFLSRCKKDEENPCPCADAVPISAEFFMEENLLSYGWIQSDSMWTSTGKQFRAKYASEAQNLEYYWEIDHEGNSSTNQTYVLSSFPTGQFNIKLKVSGTPRTDCFPGDDGLDSLTRELFVFDFDSSQESNMYGYFEYNLDGQIDTFLIKRHLTQGTAVQRLHNFLPGCWSDTTYQLDLTLDQYILQHALFLKYNNGEPLNSGLVNQYSCYGSNIFMHYDEGKITGTWQQADTANFDFENEYFPMTPLQTFEATKIYP